MPTADLERFIRLVLDDECLQRELRAVTQPSAFPTAVADAAGQRGCAVTPEDVQAALREARRSWLERWV